MVIKPLDKSPHFVYYRVGCFIKIIDIMIKEGMMNFSERLKQLREEKNLKQIDIASILEYGGTAISNYELNRTEPCISDLIKLADFFDVSVDYLVGNSNIKNHFKVSSTLNGFSEGFFRLIDNLDSSGKEELETFADWLVYKRK